MNSLTTWFVLIAGCTQDANRAPAAEGVCSAGNLDPETGQPDADCDGFPAQWDCDDTDPENACQSAAVDTLKGRWHCPEGEGSNLPNFEHVGGHFFRLIFDWEDDGWCRKLGMVEITEVRSSEDFQWVLRHEAPAEEEDFHWRTHSKGDGSFQWTMDLTALSTWNTTFPETFAVSCNRCGSIEEPSTCDAPTPPHPIDYDHQVADTDICAPVNFTNIE
ncbi:MAG: hypothetical protein VX944_17295 [Myxococcota bacterium]|nr:hypothetical protein [Myxococcota bacterium]